MKVLCVEKDRKNLKLLMTACENMPQIDETRGFTRTRNVVKYLESNAADIVIMDIDMPGMNGTTVASNLRKEYPALSMIFVSADERYAVDAFAMHISGFLLKPIDKDKLNYEIEHALQKNNL
ncbi:MAG: response regulator [Lachnospiraceae bacterium]|nr:response regulator [Lachnospiraceae bacterium]